MSPWMRPFDAPIPSCFEGHAERDFLLSLGNPRFEEAKGEGGSGQSLGDSTGAFQPEVGDWKSLLQAGEG
jgi:hypothetical protein